MDNTGILPLEDCLQATERDCIEVVKVYDQCVGTNRLSQCVAVSDVCPEPLPAGARITARLIPNTARCFFSGFGPFNPPFFRAVRIATQVDQEVTIVDASGTLICSFTLTQREVARGYMWAPEGTFVQCQILALGGGGCDLTVDPETGQQLLCCRANLCVRIQVKAEVNLVVPSFGFCTAQECVGEPTPGFVCPPEQLNAPQICEEPPVFTLQNEQGAGISGVAVSLNRTVAGATVTTTSTTNAQGEAVFTNSGAFASGFDQIRFVDPLGNVTKTFQVPAQFEDVNGVTHQITNACRITFRRAAAGSNRFLVFIDGVQLAGTV